MGDVADGRGVADDQAMAARLAAVHARIEAACRRTGRAPGSVRLMAVSKTHPAEVLREAYHAGHRLFGENKVQEAGDKAERLRDLPDLRWAFVGHLQTNKVKDVARFADEFHALDSLRVAQALDRKLQELGRGLDVYVQVNSSGEHSKYGLPADEVEQFVHEIRVCSALRVRGLMTLAAYSSEQSVVQGCFERMQALQTRLRDSGAPGSFDELSMGMSGDFELAIAHGATTVRVGEAVFGPRNLKN